MSTQAASDMPAWVQAIGSVVAIAVAIGLALWQQHENRKAQRLAAARARHDKVSGVGGLLEGLYGELYAAWNAASGGGWHSFIIAKFDPSRLRRAITALEQAPIYEVGNWPIVTSVSDAREAGVQALALLERLQDANRLNPVRLSDDEHDEIERLFHAVNRAMGPVVRALAYDHYESGPISEWKEHLDLPESMIPKHLRPPSIAKANRQLARQAVALGIKPPRTPTEYLVAVWKWQTLRRLKAEKKGRPELERP